MRPLAKRFLLEASSLLDIEQRLAKLEDDVRTLQLATIEIDDKLEETQRAFVIRICEHHPEINTFREFLVFARRERPNANRKSLKAVFHTVFPRLRSNQW